MTPKYQVLPDLTPLEYAALKSDIAEHGVLVPVEVDEAGEMLDGHHRARAWGELRDEGHAIPEFARIVRRGLTEEEKRNHARSLNVLRRQLTREQRDQVMADMRRDGMTLQAIADTVGVSVNTAWRATEDLNFDIENEEPTLVNARGQVRPTTYAPRGTAVLEPGNSLQLDFTAAEETVDRVREERTQGRRQERKEQNAVLTRQETPILNLPSRFDLVYADPPWRYEFSPTDSRVIENQYPTMALEEICSLPIGDLVIANAVLFLWAPVPKLEEAIEVVNAWGFRYRTAIVWDKVRMGMGIYTRQQVELLFPDHLQPVTA